MDYEEAVAAFFQPAPPGSAPPRPVTGAGAARRLRDAIEPLATHAFWNRLTNEANQARGLDFLSGYVWGRASALGGAAAGVVVSAFAWFEPSLITSAYEEGRSAVPLDELTRMRDEATIESLRRILPGQDAELTAVVEVLRRGLAVADGTGRALFSGLRSRPWPDDPAGRLWRACDLLREHRGDSHIAVCGAAGFDPIEMNALTELWVGLPLASYTATRAWAPAEMGAAVARLEGRGLISGGELTEAGRELRDGLEQRTDALEEPIVAAMGNDFESAVVSLGAWSQACIDAGAFPPDRRKRAAG
jgi:hypothetical protein